MDFANERRSVRPNSECGLVKAKGSKAVCISNFELVYNYFDISSGLILTEFLLDNIAFCKEAILMLLSNYEAASPRVVVVVFFFKENKDNK